MTRRVLVVGDVMTDILVIPQGPIARATDTRATIRHLPGGSGANQAVWLAAMGASVTFAGRVGQGDVPALTTHFRSRNITPHLIADPDHVTGALVCVVDHEGERSFLTDRGANAFLAPGDLPQSLLDGIALLHVSGYSLFEPGPRAAVLALMAAARASGTAISIDPASTGFLEEVGPQAFLDWTASADFFFPNADEAALLSGRNDPEGQLEILTQLYGTVILKRGANGAILARQGQPPIALPAQPVDVTDSTGAGDAFLAAFLATHLEGAPDSDALATAIAAGARAVTQIGGQPV